jgi:trimeric autotransporter adhesin
MKRGLNQENSLPDPEFGRESSESARAIHYVVQKDTLMTYEKGLFAQADPGIVSGSTIERKKMSTKTIYKRIALVAVTALGAGVLSVAPANASAVTVGGITVTKYSANADYAARTASVTTDGTAAVVLVAATASNFVAGDIGKGLYLAGSAAKAGGYCGVISAYTNATADDAGSITLAAAAICPNVTANVTARVGTPAPAAAYTTFTARDADGINSITVQQGASAALELKLGAAAGGAGDAATARIFSPTLGTLGTSAAALKTNTKILIPLTTVPNTVGSYPVKIQYSYAGTYLSTAADQIDTDFTINVTAAPTLSPALSTAYMTTPGANGATASALTNAIARTAAKTASTSIAQIKVTLLKNDGSDDASAHTVRATVTGVGYVDVAVTADATTNVTTRTDTDSSTNAIRYVNIEADGTAGTGTVVVTVEHAVTGAVSTLGTFTYTTYGDVAKLEVSTTNATIGKAGGDTTGYGSTTRTVAGNLLGVLDDATTVPAFIVKATDSTGLVANNGSTAPTVVSSNTAVVSGGTCALDGGALPTTASSSTNGVGFYNCNFTTTASSKSGDTATLTIRIVDPADATKFVSTTLAVTVGGSVSTETIAFNKASYAAGEGMVITRTAKDSSSNPVADGTTAALITFSTTVGGTTPGTGFYKGGVSASSAATSNPSVFAPATPGAFQALMTSGNAAATKLTASATVAESASMSALTTLINSLIAKINALNKLVIKIQKKVRA